MRAATLANRISCSRSKARFPMRWCVQRAVLVAVEQSGAQESSEVLTERRVAAVTELRRAQGDA